MEKDYYSILELTDDERKLQGKDFEKALSKHWKQLSIKYHPDKWSSATPEEQKAAEEKFKEISEAHTVLADEKQRQQYDMQQQGFDPNGFGGFGFDMDDFFGRRRGPAPGEDIHIEVNISLEDAFNGCTKEINIPHKEKCSECDGTGSADKKSTTCPHCHGSGRMTTIQQRGNMTFQQITTCPHCHGTGVINTNPCKKCNGTGYEISHEKRTISIPKGVKDGLNIQMQGQGMNSTEGGPNGNLIITIRIENNTNFKWINNDLYYYDNIPFTKALLGLEKEYISIDGKKYKVKIPQLTKDKAQFRIPQKGMPIINGFGETRGYGDFIIQVDYIYPTSLSNEQKKLLEDLGNSLDK